MSVYVLEPTRPDFLKGLSDFADVVILFDNARPSIFSEEYRKAIIDELQYNAFDPEVDFIAVVGKQVPLFIMGAEIASHYGAFTALLFSSSERRYIPRTVGA